MNASGLFQGLHDALSSHGLITDPGNAGTIRVGRTLGYIELVTAAAETRTLANPVVPGVILGIYMKTDGGDCTLTVTNGYTASGQTTIVFGDTGDFVVLYSVKVGSDLRWRPLATGGVSAALTAAHATLTQAGTDSGDVAIQALVQNTGFGFVLAAEGEAVIASLLNAMVRIGEIETALKKTGLMP